MRTLVIIPTYNEADNILTLLSEVTALDPSSDILVVDDSSPDGTAKLVRNFATRANGVHYLIRAEKRGLAAAYQAGFLWAFEKGYDNIIQMDADFSHPPTMLPKIVKALQNHDLVVGSRYVKGGSVSGWGSVRQLVSRGGNLYAREILNVACRDLTGGFNGWKRTTLEKVAPQTLRSQGYSFQVEMKYRALSAGARATELPIHFENRRLGKSKMSGGIVWEAAFRVLQMKFSSSAG